MKRIITVCISILISITSFAQNGINYKAVIKDVTGNLVVNQPINVRFFVSITAGVYYQEEHTTSTDDNGLIILNIGEGNPTGGTVFSDVPWNQNDITLEVQINLGDGWVTMGEATDFKTVPYALVAEEAKNAQGLTQLDQGNGIGWRIPNRGIPEEYGDIGLNAVDLSYCTDGTIPRGAMGDYSTAFGSHTIATGNLSFASGSISTATGNVSTAFGWAASARGDNSVAMGTSVSAEAFGSTVVGLYNVIDGGNQNEWVATDSVFEIGNGSSSTDRSNALTVLKNGNVGIGTNAPLSILHIANGNLRIGTLEEFSDGGNLLMQVNSSFTPTINGNRTLGNSSFRWSTVYATNGTINTSDRRDKVNIASLNYGLNEIMQLKPVSFNWKDTPHQGHKLGLIAQDLLEVIPEVVNTHDDVITDERNPTRTIRVEAERLGVYYSDLIPVLIKAIQEQQATISSLNKLNDKQKAERQRLQKNYLSLLSRVEALEVSSSN